MKANLKQSGSIPDTASYNEIIKFYLPLLINTSVLVLIPPIINYGLSWSSNPPMAYAIYSASFSVQVFLNGLILTQRKATLSIGKNPNAFQAVHKFYLFLSLLISLLFILFGHPPRDLDLFEHFFNLPKSMASQSSELILLLSPTPVILTLRTTFQSLALLNRKSGIVSFGTCARIVLSLASIVGLIRYSELSVISSMAITYLLSYGIETLLLMMALNKHKSPPHQDETSRPTYSQIFSFSAPLCLSSLSWSLIFPIINYFIGKIDDGSGIAAFGVIRPLILFYGGPLMCISSLILIFHHDKFMREKVLKFCLSVSMIVSTLIAILIKTGIARTVLKDLYKLPDHLVQESMGASGYFILFPMAFFLKYYYEGKCLLNKHSKAVGVISFISIAFLITAGFFSLRYRQIDSGVNLGISIMFFSILAEGLLLFSYTHWNKFKWAY